MSRNKDSLQQTLIVAFLLCLVCSIVVSSAAVLLKDRQTANKLLERNRNVLAAAGMYETGQTAEEINAVFDQFQVKLVDLDNGKYLGQADLDSLGLNVDSYNQRRAAKDDQFSRRIPSSEDIAVIKRRANYALIYVLEKNGIVEKVVLPVHGYGLWGILYGFLAVSGDANTVLGLTFYEHQETPGLGAEVDNPKWKAQWPGKKIYNAEQNVALTVIKGKVLGESEHEIDGLSGATLTTRGVANLIQYWMGDTGFGSFLVNLKAGEA